MGIDNNNDDKANHTVYISFDNNDSSISSFTNYLKATFNRHGINLLHDQSDCSAEQIRILLVVFSSNYTFSVPCLKKLVNHFNTKDLIVVVPVLHGVTLTYVKQKITMLESWNIVDHVTMLHNEKESEPEFMEKIARDVFEKLYPTEEIGIHEKREEIEKLLCKQPWGVRTLGIFGEPGIGKTTLALAAFRHMSDGYDDSFFVRDFDAKYTEKRIKSLPPEFLSDTPMEKFHLNDSDVEPSQRKKRVLVVLDDVRDAGKADLYLGGYEQFGPGSLIIITSQYREILENCKMNEIYELEGLNDEDALKLFTRCAFGKDVITENQPDVMKEIQRCGGNPSALRLSANGFMHKKMVEIGPASSDVCEVSITSHDVSCGISKNTYMRIISCDEDDEPPENKEFPIPSDHNAAVLGTRGYKPIILTPSILCPEPDVGPYSQKNPRSVIYSRAKSLPTNLMFYQLDYNAVMRSLSEHLHQTHHALVQRFASPFQKLWQSFSKSRDLSQLERDLQHLLDLSGGCNRINYFINVVRKNRELNLDGIYGLREI